MPDGMVEADSVTDPILLSLVDVTILCEASGDPETLMGLHIAIQSRCIALGIDGGEVLRRFMGMDQDLDFLQFG